MAVSGTTWSQRGDADRRAMLERLDRLAYWLDDWFRVPGTGFRVGLDGLVGLVPGVGDVVTSALTAYIVYQAWRLGIPKSMLARMLANLGIDTLVGIVPIAGDLFDLSFRANRRNVHLLRRHLGERLERERRLDAEVAPRARRRG